MHAREAKTLHMRIPSNGMLHRIAMVMLTPMLSKAMYKEEEIGETIKSQSS